MKPSIFFTLVLGFPFLYSCNQQNNQSAVPKSDTSFTKSCYIAIDGKDTATLTVKKYPKKTGGALLLNLDKKENNNGQIEGNFKGDTLFVDYVFQIGNKGRWYRNPLALLKKDGKLIMGVGKMETTWGKTYFRKDIPIDFVKGRFIFEPVNCK
jgi:hypothetical protein